MDTGLNNPESERILVVEDTESLREVLCAVLSCEGYQVRGAGSAEAAIEQLQKETFSLVLSDLKLPQKSGIDLLRESREICDRVPVVVMTAYGSIDLAVEAMKFGAIDFITKPFDPPMLCRLIRDVISQRRVINHQLTALSARRPHQFVSQSKAMNELLRQASRVAPLTSPVLILGESGTGKELIARLIHQQSPRAAKNFVGVNCASMPSDLLESEFFGHEAGAFTGATEERPGLFELADRGTIFLDEIGNMPLALQIKLLRTLQEGEIKKLGSTKIQKVDVRVISATNADLNEHMKNGTFREDLYYRLGVVILEIPPLRERPEDVELLANYFAKFFCGEFDKPFHQLSPEVITALRSYPWPGNVRELENVIERAIIFHSGPNDGPLSVDKLELSHHCTDSHIPQQTLAEVAGHATHKAEREVIARVLGETHGNKSKAARILGVSYKTLLNKVKEYQLGVVEEAGGGDEA